MQRSDTNGLKEALGVGMLTMYGVGAIIGAGIFTVIGEAMRVAGPSLVVCIVQILIQLQYSGQWCNSRALHFNLS